MSEEIGLLRALMLNPEDHLARSAYADWLEERGDGRAEYLRLERALAGLPVGDTNVDAWGRRLAHLREPIDPDWLVRVGSRHVSSGTLSDSPEPDPDLCRRVAQMLGRPVEFVDAEHYTCTLNAAAIHPVSGAFGYVECRSQWRGQWQDIGYYLHVRQGDDREAGWQIETYNPFFGCEVRFLEWYGDSVVMVYREKHHTYISRFGFDQPARWKQIEDDWVLSGPQLGFWGYKAENVNRIAIPSLKPLPPVSPDEAKSRGLLPDRFW